MHQQIIAALRQSIHRIILVLVQFLPAVSAFLVALFLFTLAGFLIAALVRSVLTALKFDERLSSSQSPDSPARIADWSPSHSPTLLLTRIALWGSIFLGVAVGIQAFNASYSADAQFSALLLPYVTHVTGAILILLAGSLIARFLSRSVLIGAVNAQLQYARFLSLGIKWLVLVLASAMALDHLQVGGNIVELAFGILFGGIVLTLSLAIGLGSRDLVSRSIEKSIDKSPNSPTPISPIANPDAAPRPKLHHF
jgi:hypothetical protein